jgi:pre-mRNA-processing factor 17
MHAISATDKHPNGKYFLGQSSDNKILTFDVKGQSIRLNKKKKFLGHLNSGYSVEVKVSPDGQFVASGDHDGRVFFYDWKSAKVYSVLHAHDNVCVGMDWHPNDSSKFVTCSWDGLVKLWGT